MPCETLNLKSFLPKQPIIGWSNEHNVLPYLTLKDTFMTEALITFSKSCHLNNFMSKYNLDDLDMLKVE